MRAQVACGLWSSYALLLPEVDPEAVEVPASEHEPSSDDESCAESAAVDPSMVQLPAWTSHLMYFPPTEAGQVRCPLLRGVGCHRPRRRCWRG